MHPDRAACVHSTPIERAAESAETLRERLRGEVTTELRASERRRGWRRRILRCGGCCGGYLLALLAIPVIALAIVARTGLVTVPVISTRITHDRAPVRIVTPPAPQSMATLVDAKVRAGMQRAGRAPDRLTLTFTEREITGALRHALGESSEFPATVREYAQIAVDPTRIELSTRMDGIGDAETTVRIVGAPVLADGRWTVDVEEVTIGALRIPRLIVRPLVRRMMDRIFVAEAVPFILERVDLAVGAIVITVRNVR